jgi:hypothetical protein
MGERGEKYLSGDVAALVILVRARKEAEERRADVWQYAVRRSQFEAAGVQFDELDRLVRVCLIAAREETTGRGERRRTFRALRAGRMPPRACFVLTPAGAALFGAAEDAGRAMRPKPAVQPVWDADRGELRAGGWLVKQFGRGRPAKNQKLILDVFQEDGWPWHIDSPLTPADRRDPSRPQRDTVRALNDRQVVPLIRFGSDGAGEGFVWTWVLPNGWNRLRHR